MRQKYILGTVLVILIAAGGVYHIAPRAKDTSPTQTAGLQTDTNSSEEQEMQGGAMFEGIEPTAETSVIPASDKITEPKPVQLAPPPSIKAESYKEYSEATVAAEQKAGNKIVLFFHATWCPECRAADAAFKAHPEKIPAGVTVLKTDYDSNTALKKKYVVTYQHTFVQIDNNGNLVTKWISGDIAALKKNIK